MATTQANAGATGRWDLTAPESGVLLNGAGASTQPFKLALTELLMRGALKIIESKGHFRSKTVLVADGPRPEAPTEPALTPVWNLYKASKAKTTKDGTGVPVQELAVAAKNMFGAVGNYAARTVAPLLQERGLMEWHAKKVLFIFNSGSWVLTPAGETKKAELQHVLDDGKANMPQWVAGDAAQAAAFLGAAGAAILLEPKLFPQLKQLKEVPDVDFDGADFDTDFDLSSFDSMDSAFDAIDSSVDAGGSDSGGSDSGGSSSD